jgi:hypothetical protein
MGTVHDIARARRRRPRAPDREIHERRVDKRDESLTLRDSRTCQPYANGVWWS